MTNELIFLGHSTLVASITLGLLVLGREGLTAGVCLFSVLSNLFVTKQITLFGLHTISTDVFTIGAVFGLNLLQEHFGIASVKRAITCNFALLIAYLALCQVHLAYTPNAFDTMQTASQALLTPMLRIIVASVASYLLSQLFDMHLYRLLKQYFAGRHVVLRNILSLSCSQLVDTVFFSFAALYGTVHSVGHVIIVSYAIKMLVVVGISPFIGLSKKLLRYIPHA